MKRYCIDTSGLSWAHEMMPEDIHVTLWAKIATLIQSGALATTPEVYEEMTHIPGQVGDCIKSHENELVLEVGKPGWDFLGYINHNSRMLIVHENYISEYTNGSKKTICLNDMTVCALGRSLSLPVISGERACPPEAIGKRKIPNVCSIEGILHMNFNDFLRAEGITA